MHKTSIDQMHFTQTPIDYKSIDLEYTSQQKDYKEKRPQKKSVKEKVGYDHWGKHFKLVARESNEKSKHRNKRLQKDESEFKLMKGRM